LNQRIPYSFRWVDPYLCVWLGIDSKRDEDGAILLERRIAPMRFQLIAIRSNALPLQNLFDKNEDAKLAKEPSEKRYDQ
jgi:hypothetical protein